MGPAGFEPATPRLLARASPRIDLFAIKAECSNQAELWTLIKKHVRIFLKVWITSFSSFAFELIHPRKSSYSFRFTKTTGSTNMLSNMISSLSTSSAKNMSFLSSSFSFSGCTFHFSFTSEKISFLD